MVKLLAIELEEELKAAKGDGREAVVQICGLALEDW